MPLIILVVTLFFYGAGSPPEGGVKNEPTVAACKADAAKYTQALLKRDGVRDVQAHCLVLNAPDEPRDKS